MEKSWASWSCSVLKPLLFLNIFVAVVAYWFWHFISLVMWKSFFSLTVYKSCIQFPPMVESLWWTRLPKYQARDCLEIQSAECLYWNPCTGFSHVKGISVHWSKNSCLLTSPTNWLPYIEISLHFCHSVHFSKLRDAFTSVMSLSDWIHHSVLFCISSVIIDLLWKRSGIIEVKQCTPHIVIGFFHSLPDFHAFSLCWKSVELFFQGHCGSDLSCCLRLSYIDLCLVILAYWTILFYGPSI